MLPQHKAEILLENYRLHGVSFYFARVVNKNLQKYGHLNATINLLGGQTYGCIISHHR